MAKRINERYKIDIGLVGQTLNNNNITGRYYSMKGARKAIALLTGGALATTKTTKIEFLQATDAAGTGAKAITNASATVTSETGVTVATITLASVLNTQAVTINGLVFTAHTDTTTYASRQFKIDGDDAADAAALVLCINHATYGVPGVTAESALGVITLKSTVPGATLITVTDAAATITPATLQYQAYVELDANDLDAANGFVYIAPKITSTGNGIVQATVLRELRGNPTQKVGASAAI